MAKKSIESLKQLAEAIGWRKVAEDRGFTSYDYLKDMSRYESVTYLLKVFETEDKQEFFQTLFVIKSVLPKKLKKKVDKITKNIKPDSIDGAIDILKFVIDEYKAKSEYSKLRAYAEIAGLKLLDLGYNFEYEINHRKRQEIIAKIEAALPMEIAPALGKIKKTEFKIAYAKEHKNRYIQKPDEE